MAWRPVPLGLRGAQVLCVVSMAVAMYLIVFSEHTVLPWIFGAVGGPGSALVQWRVNKTPPDDAG
jgi:hypothetical protein